MVSFFGQMSIYFGQINEVVSQVAAQPNDNFTAAQLDEVVAEMTIEPRIFSGSFIECLFILKWHGYIHSFSLWAQDRGVIRIHIKFNRRLKRIGTFCSRFVLTPANYRRLTAELLENKPGGRLIVSLDNGLYNHIKARPKITGDTSVVGFFY